MSRLVVVLLSLLLMAVGAQGQSTRIASDFEIQQMERQAASAKDFLSQLSAHLNLGDVRTTRNETAIAAAEYQKALDIAVRERSESRKAGNLSRYATATMYEGLAAAKSGRDDLAFDTLEEAARYAGDDATTWNLYATAMQLIGRPQKAVSASRNAVAIAEAEEKKSPTVVNALDLAVYQYSLARSLRDTISVPEGQYLQFLPAAQQRASIEAVTLLERVVASLRSSRFDALRKDVARSESFEIYSSARGEAAAYISLLNRSQLLLAALYEQRGERDRARDTFEAVLATRSDDATALAARARLATSEEQRARSFADAFDANPFSIDTIHAYERWLWTAKRKPNDDTSTGALVRRAMEQSASGQFRAARATLDALITRYPANDVLQYLAAKNDLRLGDAKQALSRNIRIRSLREEIDDEARAAKGTKPLSYLMTAAGELTPSTADLQQTLLALSANQLVPEQMRALDRISMTSVVAFAPGPAANPGQTVFERGSIDGVPFRFSEPTAFSGTFIAGAPLRLTYRILGVTELNDADVLLLEPMKLEVVR